MTQATLISKKSLVSGGKQGQQSSSAAYQHFPSREIFDAHVEVFHVDPDTGEPCAKTRKGAKKQVRRFGRRELEEIARRCNARSSRGALTPLTLGHTDPDEPDESKQPPAVGYARNFTVRRDPNRGGNWMLYADFYVRKSALEKAKSFPRVSIELWPEDRVIDPIALLRRTPQRDLRQWTYARSRRQGLLLPNQNQKARRYCLRYSMQESQTDMARNNQKKKQRYGKNGSISGGPNPGPGNVAPPADDTFSAARVNRGSVSGGPNPGVTGPNYANRHKGFEAENAAKQKIDPVFDSPATIPPTDYAADGGEDHAQRMEQFMAHCFSHPHARALCDHYAAQAEELLDGEGDGEEDGLDEFADEGGEDGDGGVGDPTLPPDFEDDGLGEEPTDDYEGDDEELDEEEGDEDDFGGEDEEEDEELPVQHAAFASGTNGGKGVIKKQGSKKKSYRKDAEAVRYARLQQELQAIKREAAEAKAQAIVTQLVSEGFDLDADVEVPEFAKLGPKGRAARDAHIRRYYRQAPTMALGRIRPAVGPDDEGESGGGDEAEQKQSREQKQIAGATPVQHDKAMRYMREHPGTDYTEALRRFVGKK